MGILKDLPVDYYKTDGDHGSYRHIPLSEIIDSFAATYVGEGTTLIMLSYRGAIVMA